VKRERAKHVCLIGTICIEPIASCEPIEEVIKIFEEEAKSRELEEELEATLIFFRITTTFTTTT
jgi:hypothetical protein